MIANFSIDVAEVVGDSGVGHGLGVDGVTPDRFFDVLLVHDWVLFSLLHVTFLRSDSLVITSMKRITLLEGSEQRIFNDFPWFIREFFISSEGLALVVEGSSLLYVRGERLVTEQDIRVILGIPLSFNVLFTLVWVTDVFDLGSERQVVLSVEESWSSFTLLARRGSVVHVFEFTLSNKLVRTAWHETRLS